MKSSVKWLLTAAVVLAGLTFVAPSTARAARWRVAPRYRVPYVHHHVYPHPHYAPYYGHYGYVRPYRPVPVIVRPPLVRVLVPGRGIHVHVGGIVDVHVGPFRY